MTSIGGARYARALADVAFAPNAQVKAGEAAQQLRSVQELLESSEELRNALLTPAVASARKRAVIEQFAGLLGLSRIVRNFLFVLINHRRVGELRGIIEAFEQIVDERLGFARAEVSSAQPLGEEQRAELERELSQVSGKQVRVSVKVDPALIGGVAARIGSTVYDGSVRSELEQMRRRLTRETADYEVKI